jgi:signal transduction histidine kinase
MYLSFWPAVMLSSWYGGLWPGVLCAALCEVSIQLFWLRAFDSLAHSRQEIVAQAAFFLLATAISILNEQRLRAIESAHKHAQLAVARLATLEQEMKERSALEEDLIDANRALARSNEDLSGFAHMIGHDLQEPLRTMILYGELLRRRYAELLGVQGAEWLQTIEQSAKRLTHMIRNLLDYAKAGRGSHAEMREVALSKSLGVALNNLEDLILSVGAVVNVGTLPILRGDEIQLSQLFQNLVANAIKYRREGVGPVISVEACKKNGCWIVSVRDNGVGVETSQHERIFKPFVRVTAKSDGSGIGLATCTRIVERHGGKIWLEESNEAGSTFCFSIAAEEYASERIGPDESLLKPSEHR